MKKVIPLIIIIMTHCLTWSYGQQQNVLQYERLNDTREARVKGIEEETEAGRVVTQEEVDNPDTGPQYVLRSQIRKQTWVEGRADTDFFHTSNVFLSESAGSGEVDTSVLVQAVEASFSPNPGIEAWYGMLFPKIGFRQQWYFYGLTEDSAQADRLDDLDFYAQTAFGKLEYAFGEMAIAHFGIEYTRLVTDENGIGEFYNEILPNWGIQKSIPLNFEDTYLTFSYDGNYHAAETVTFFGGQSDILDRTDQSFTGAVSTEIVQNLFARLFYRFKYTGFIEDAERDDLTNTVGLGLNYYFNQYASIRGYWSYETRDSSGPFVADYEKMDTGVGVSGILRF
ncbi:MAG: outer membrane beta-barrel protein [Verrucomicrobiota bacterium]|nr:outer membrane beta-barrel protein [Verrucomicrobiota bacterium]